MSIQFTDVCLITENVPRLKAFYEMVFGGAAAGDEVHSSLALEGLILTFDFADALQKSASFQYVSSRGSNNAIIGFNFEDVDMEYRRLTDAGIETLNQPTTHPWGARSFQFRDPDGNILNFRSRPKADAAPLFRGALEGDFPAIMAMYGETVKRLNARGNRQWDETYPSKELLRRDFARRELYVGILDGGEPAVAFVLTREADEEYTSGSWAFETDNFAVVHRLCVNPAFAGRRLGRAALLEAEKRARELRCDVMRLDTYTGNTSALGLYAELGYRPAGRFCYADWYDDMQFELFEKKL